jgi:hypothetical protein
MIVSEVGQMSGSSNFTACTVDCEFGADLPHAASRLRKPGMSSGKQRSDDLSP